MTRWQYTYRSEVSSQLNHALVKIHEYANQLGTDGWELVNFTAERKDNIATGAMGTSIVCAVFKRPYA